MKKKLISATFVIAIALTAGYNVYNSQNKVALSDLALDNVEALASGEVIVGPWYCVGSFYCHDTETGMTFDGTKYYF